MFFHLKNAITICVATACLIGSGTVNAQTQSNNSEFSRRMAAMQQARQRTETTTVVTQQPAAQAAPRIARASAPVKSHPVRIAQAGSATRAIAPIGGFVPQHLSSPVMGGTIIDGGSPIVQGGIVQGGIVDGGQIISHGPIVGSSQVMGAPIGSSIVGNEVIMGDSYEVVSEGSSGSCGCDSGSCGCGDLGESYFAGDCCGRGGCAEAGPCILSRFGKIFSQAEYFGGFTSFRSNLYSAPNNSDQLVDDSSHGVYAGFNLGLPLCRLGGGLFSGQFGVRTVNTNFGGAAFTDDDRNQIFMTAGLFRRVDYGLQVGVVADILREEWFSDVDLVQIRGEIGYVWQGGTSFGFRFARNVQDDQTEGEFNGDFFSDSIVSTNDWYRFFLRHEVARGGYGEIFGGWTDNEQGIIGLDFDFPVTNRIAFQSGFTYYLSDAEIPTDQGFLGGEPDDSFNIFVGFSLRPNGRKHYRNYERPLFDVADNGTMMMYRQ